MSARLLWVDDEIDHLKAHCIFLEKRGYQVTTVSNGRDAISLCQSDDFDLVLLDENMPGLSGLETLSEIKNIHPNLPVVMVTKNEAEDIMDQAIGAKIADYLLKPVNPMQILLTLKKNIHQREIVQEQTETGYRQDFAQISLQMDDARDAQAWQELYRRLVAWELQLEESADPAMNDMLRMQKEEANA
ncbi:MAG: response regulator, partial [Bacteroidaceae bacterium]|nr:response regulator [Bacteroidaceae bacterium]